MGDRFRAIANIKGVRIGEKRLAAELTDVSDDTGQKNGSHIGRIARLAEMELDSHQVVGLDEVFRGSLFHQTVDLVEQAETVFYSDVSEVHRAFHDAFLIEACRAAKEN